ncbi:MAG: pilus assembly protein [Victivallales bacterium]|nr:pilus assembly protein [Victivallales bacterium]
MKRWKLDIQDDKGTALMEFVLVMPLFVFMIFCIIQLALVCMAKQLLHYAAFSAARAAIVYHPSEYSQNGVFYMSNGVAHQAACTAMSWMAQLPGGPSPLNIPGWGDVPGSGFAFNQVFIDPDNSAILPDVPAVKVTVEFYYPLHIPFAGAIIGYFNNDGKVDGKWTEAGLLPEDMVETLSSSKVQGVNCFRMQETCIMPMPWDSNLFPRAEKTPYLGTEGI